MLRLYRSASTQDRFVGLLGPILLQNQSPAPQDQDITRLQARRRRDGSLGRGRYYPHPYMVSWRLRGAPGVSQVEVDSAWSDDQDHERGLVSRHCKIDVKGREEKEKQATSVSIAS